MLFGSLGNHSEGEAFGLLQFSEGKQEPDEEEDDDDDRKTI